MTSADISSDRSDMSHPVHTWPAPPPHTALTTCGVLQETDGAVVFVTNH